jgi:putative endonuclease
LTAGLTRQERGKLAETMAAEYLQKQGLKLLKRNFRTKAGEIDLIMQHEDIIVFVEVRYRAKVSYMHAIETIDKFKVQKIIQASRYFLQSWVGAGNLFRFDIVTLTGKIDTPEISWIKNAFFNE